MNSEALVAHLAAATGLIDPELKKALATNAGAAFEAFTLYTLGEALLSHGWQWHHPAGAVTFSVRSGCSIDEALDSYSTVSLGDYVLMPSVTVIGRSGSSHDLDLAVLDLTRVRDVASWEAVCVVIECKNVGRARGPGVARDLVGLAAELRLGAQYRNYASRGYPPCGLVTAHGVTANATGILDRWKLDQLDHYRPTTFGSRQGVFGMWAHGAIQ